MSGRCCSADLARAYQERVEAFVGDMEGETLGSLLVGERHTELRPTQHRFRDRDKTRELGRPYVSSMRSPARRALRGGGSFNPTATAQLEETPVPLDSTVRAPCQRRADVRLSLTHARARAG